jgi:hypothetical protein
MGLHIHSYHIPVFSYSYVCEILRIKHALRVFSCVSWPNLCPYKKRKLVYRTKWCALLGYSPLHKGFKCLDVSSGHVYIPHDVIFDESICFLFLHFIQMHVLLPSNTFLFYLNNYFICHMLVRVCMLMIIYMLFL